MAGKKDRSSFETDLEGTEIEETEDTEDTEVEGTETDGTEKNGDKVDFPVLSAQIPRNLYNIFSKIEGKFGIKNRWVANHLFIKNKGIVAFYRECLEHPDPHMLIKESCPEYKVPKVRPVKVPPTEDLLAEFDQG